MDLGALRSAAAGVRAGEAGKAGMQRGGRPQRGSGMLRAAALGEKFEGERDGWTEINCG